MRAFWLSLFPLPMSDKSPSRRLVNLPNFHCIFVIVADSLSAFFSFLLAHSYSPFTQKAHCTESDGSPIQCAYVDTIFKLPLYDTVISYQHRILYQNNIILSISCLKILLNRFFILSQEHNLHCLQDMLFRLLQ